MPVKKWNAQQMLQEELIAACLSFKVKGHKFTPVRPPLAQPGKDSKSQSK